VHANVGLQVNCGSSRRALEMTRMTVRPKGANHQ
jgi:hypothetical protein